MYFSAMLSYVCEVTIPSKKFLFPDLRWPHSMHGWTLPPRNYNQCMADSQWKWSLPCMALNAWWHHFGSWSGGCLLAWPITYVSLLSVGLSVGTSPPIQQAARKLQTGCRHCVCCNRYLTYSTIVVKRCKHGCHSNIVLSRSNDVVFLIW